MNISSREITNWPLPWEEVADDLQRQLLTEELQKEVTEGHLLWRRTFEVIARSRGGDDILVQVAGSESPYAQVHLTWSSKPETDPRWPGVATFSSLQEWRDKWAALQ